MVLSCLTLSNSSPLITRLKGSHTPQPLSNHRDLKCVVVSRDIYEIFTSFQGEGSLLGRRQIFIRFRGCPLECFYCDTRAARMKDPSLPPARPEKVIETVKELITPDLHSVSFTGGEPLASPDLLRELAERCRGLGLSCYLETAGVDARIFQKLIDLFDYAAIDVKLENHRAVETRGAWKKLYQEEIECIRTSAASGLHTIVKVVIPDDTTSSQIESLCREISDYRIDLILQPLTGIKAPSLELLFDLSATAGRYLGKQVMVIPQIHRLYQDGLGKKMR
ncbi:MAG TPA: 7-carboxy-7-deazaguanine synthase QueE [Candidatus Syntrophoarchaeum butanivorans]|uniref:7-carboxy-7-deazaguanine synthase n=1 Tax=Candidatus Syntropharchaeum butanivorans TaxID=1839936 RepID=A0A7J2S0T9_9EURY|nr:7-carboxy-7-deazaguanine synthase QueE [Candidatus Syntrophoarchaeum butanivorans]